MPPLQFDCIVCGTCVADILVRPVPLTEPVGGGRLFHVEHEEYEIIDTWRISRSGPLLAQHKSTYKRQQR
jgi:hypothetical protein